MADITPDMKLMDLIKKYPFLTDELPKKNKKFKLLKTPMAKVLMRNADIKEMSKHSGIAVDELISMLNKLIESN